MKLMKIIDKLLGFFIIFLVISGVILIIFVGISEGIKETKEDKICSDIFPSPIQEEYNIYANDWSENKGVEEGFIKCC